MKREKAMTPEEKRKFRREENVLRRELYRRGMRLRKIYGADEYQIIKIGTALIVAGTRGKKYTPLTFAEVYEFVHSGRPSA